MSRLDFWDSYIVVVLKCHRCGHKKHIRTDAEDHAEAERRAGCDERCPSCSPICKSCGALAGEMQQCRECEPILGHDDGVSLPEPSE